MIAFFQNLFSSPADEELKTIFREYVRDQASVDLDNLRRALSLIPLYRKYNILAMTYDKTNTVLHWAARRGNTSVCKCILDSVTDQKYNLLTIEMSNGNNVLTLAALKGHTETDI